MKSKKIEKIKRYYSEQKPTKLSWPMTAKSDQIILFKKKKTTQNHHAP